MAKSAPGVAAAPKMSKNSVAGAGRTTPDEEQSKPTIIAMIIGFLINPSPTVRSTPKLMRPSREPTIKITIKLPNTS